MEGKNVFSFEWYYTYFPLMFLQYLEKEYHYLSRVEQSSAPGFIFSLLLHTRYGTKWICMRWYIYLSLKVRREGSVFICWYSFWSSFISYCEDLVSDFLRSLSRSKHQLADSLTNFSCYFLFQCKPFHISICTFFNQFMYRGCMCKNSNKRKVGS